MAVETVDCRVPVMGRVEHGSARRAATLARAYEKAGSISRLGGAPPVGPPTAGMTSSSSPGRWGRRWAAAPRPGLEPQRSRRRRRVLRAPPRRLPELPLRQARGAPRPPDPRCAPSGPAAGNAVGVLEGCGGEYMLELLPAGIVGVMPGLALVDVLQRVWDLGAGRTRRRGVRALRPHPPVDRVLPPEHGVLQLPGEGPADPPGAPPRLAPAAPADAARRGHDGLRGVPDGPRARRGGPARGSPA